MFSEEEDFEVGGRERSLSRMGKAAFNAVFVTLFRPFNSRAVTVGKNSRAQSREYYKYEQIGASGMSLLTENFLRGNLLLRYLKKNPLRILDSLGEFYRISQDTSYLLIAADLCRFFSERTKKEVRLKYHLSAFRFCFLAFHEQKRRMAEKGQANVRSLENYLLLQELQVLNSSIAGVFSYLKKKNLLDSNTFTLKGIDGSTFVFEEPVFQLSVPRSAVSDFSLCSDYAINSLRLINRHSGAGVPLVAKVAPVQLSSSLRTPPGLTIPVTLMFRTKVLDDNRLSVTPYYQDTSIRETFSSSEGGLASGDWTLASDFTAPLACFMGSIQRRNLLSVMLHPVKYDSDSGLYMVEPYHPGKIPVVFVHGLMSSPETWGQMINMLKYDPIIRQKYQFWFYYYSTGVPVLYSARNLQRTLLEAQKEFCTTPDATKSFEQMVLVGHSMGGLITKLLLQENPYQIMEKLSGKKWDELRQKLSEKEQQMVEDFTIIQPLPFVKRAVFMAVPHRGADMATRGLANLGIRLIQLPRAIVSKRSEFETIIQKILPAFGTFWRNKNFITGIDNLNPHGPFVRWSQDEPLKSDVVYHSIIGNRKAAAIPGGSDGIVPYLSSHLNGIESEFIVKSDHSVHRNPAAIRELLRILRLHLAEGGSGTAAPKPPDGDR